ncbi:MAG: hypothetical protein JRI23_28865, partial [Deltaproteobacteria bacterium]|nr:hypothetical protein [Deltaproteobacteria bacterium]MBW2536135.1 hypothetical protein [Deltaproteobacteria bacterium]
GTKVTAAQSFAELVPTGPVRRSELMAGLPLTKDGWVVGDVDLGGRFPKPMWLARVETSRGAGSAGVLFERNPLYYGYQGKAWKLDPRARDAATPGGRPPDLPGEKICEPFGEKITFASYAVERKASGDSLVAGRCEDSRHRAQAGVHLASFASGTSDWQTTDAPAADLFASIVNLGLVSISKKEAYLYAYPPYEDKEREAYLVRFNGKKWKPVEVPFQGPIVSMAGSKETLWAIRAWSELWRFRKGKWSQVSLPPPVYVEPKPERLRLLEVQLEGGHVWVHGAYPIWLEGAERTAARGHVLFSSSALEEPFFCDRTKPAREALAAAEPEPRLEGAVEIR